VERGEVEQGNGEGLSPVPDVAREVSEPVRVGIEEQFGQERDDEKHVDLVEDLLLLRARFVVRMELRGDNAQNEVLLEDGLLPINTLNLGNSTEKLGKI
jgi:hypothetical protein